MISIYKDTNTVNANLNDTAINELEKLAELYPDNLMFEKTDTLDTELSENPPYNAARLKKSDGYIESYGVAVLGHSRLGHSLLGNELDEKQFSEILEIIFGKKVRSSYTKQEIRDAMHIMTTIRYGGNYLITYDKKLLAKSEQLFKRFNSTIICTPGDCLIKVKPRLSLILGIKI